MGTGKNGHFGENFWPLAARIRDESAGSRRKRHSHDLRPPAAPSSHTPLGKSIPRLIKSSTHFRPRFIKQALQDTQAYSTQN
jgi:hypothetical protein